MVWKITRINQPNLRKNAVPLGRGGLRFQYFEEVVGLKKVHNTSGEGAIRPGR